MNIPEGLGSAVPLVSVFVLLSRVDASPLGLFSASMSDASI